MSIESVKAYLERVRTDKGFADRLARCSTAMESLAFVKAEGFDFTREEFEAVRKELSPEELNTVMGGVDAFISPNNSLESVIYLKYS